MPLRFLNFYILLRRERFVVPLICAFIGCVFFVPWPEMVLTPLAYQNSALANWATVQSRCSYVFDDSLTFCTRPSFSSPSTPHCKERPVRSSGGGLCGICREQVLRGASIVNPDKRKEHGSEHPDSSLIKLSHRCYTYSLQFIFHFYVFTLLPTRALIQS